jgi:hypothetical protein
MLGRVLVNFVWCERQWKKAWLYQQELVYKNGQAGVTKATVSVTFDNREKKQSPLGYEHYDEITITRQVSCSMPNIYSNFYDMSHVCNESFTFF